MKKKRIELSTEWLTNWKPTRTTEVPDCGCKGLVVRGGPSGSKTFYRWTDARDEGTGLVRRQRVRLGSWPALSLRDAQKAVREAREGRWGPTAGTVADLADAYHHDVLAHRERGDEAFAIIRTHVLDARPDPKHPPFGERLASMIRPADIAGLVRYAKQPRTVETTTKTGLATTRRLGGPRVAAVTLRELKALFAHAVETGALEMTPCGVMRSRAFGLHNTSRARVLDTNEVQAFFEAIDLTALLNGTAKRKRLSATVRLALAFQLLVPLRSQSLIGARWEEIDFDAKLWTVPVARLKMRAEERATARPFVVPLPTTAIAILRKLREQAGASPWVLAAPLPPAPGEEFRHLEEKALIRALSRLQSNGRLEFAEHLTVHDLRRTWRSFAMDLGVDHVVAERSLGHVAALRAAGFGGAADVYGRSQLVEQRAAAAELVASAFDRIRLGETGAIARAAEGE